jgi:hypothetical protein
LQTNGSASQSAAASASNAATQSTASNQLAAGSTIQATLAKSVDARKSKPGDEVVAKTTSDVKSNGQVVIPRGSKIIGHVTQAQGRAKGQSDSMLGIAFDHAVLKDGRQVPVAASIQALAGAEEETASAVNMSDDLPMAGQSAGGRAAGRASAPDGLVGGAGGAVGVATGTVANTAGAVGSSAAGTVNGAAATASPVRLALNSQGVVGLNGLSLNAGAANSTQGSVISSSSQNVHLDSGTQMVLRVNQ